jgi:O-antigen/teichoic acid export membrane protein
MSIIPFSLVFVTFPEIIINLFFGSKYLPASFSLQLLSIGCIFLAIYVVISTILNGIGKPIEATKVILITFIINLILNLILIPNYGIIGSSISAVISYIFCFILVLYVIKRELENAEAKFILPIVPLIKIIFAGITTTILIFILKMVIVTNPWIEFFIILIVSTIFYIFLILRLGCITLQELKLLTKINVPIPKTLIKFIKRIIKNRE